MWIVLQSETLFQKRKKRKKDKLNDREEGKRKKGKKEGIGIEREGKEKSKAGWCQASYGVKVL